MKKLTLKQIVEKRHNEYVQDAINKGAILVTDKDQSNQIFYELDQRNIKIIQDNISIANEWADEIHDIVKSGKQLSRDEWEAHKLSGLRYIDDLETARDPRKKIFLHLQENQAMSEHLSKRLEQTLNTAINRLKASINVIEGEIKALQIKTRQPEKHYNHLDELFKNPDDVEPCMKALNKVYPPIVNEEGQYIGKLAGAFVVWVEALRYRSKLHPISDKLLVELLIKKFPDLKISDSLFRQPTKTANDKYKQEFRNIIK
jgi:hypothetical protein